MASSAAGSIPHVGQGIVILAVVVSRRATEGCAWNPFPAAEDQELELLSGDPSHEATCSIRALDLEGARRWEARSAAVLPFGSTDALSCWQLQGGKEMQLAASPACSPSLLPSQPGSGEPSAGSARLLLAAAALQWLPSKCTADGRGRLLFLFFTYLYK